MADLRTVQAATTGHLSQQIIGDLATQRVVGTRANVHVTAFFDHEWKC
jgi:hypothetical protein